MIWWLATSAMVVAYERPRRGLVQADRGRGVPAAPVRCQGRPTVGHDRVVDGVPIAGQLSGDIGDPAACSDLHRRSSGAAGRLKAFLSRNAMAETGPTVPPHSQVADRSDGACTTPHASAARRRANRRSALSVVS